MVFFRCKQFQVFFFGNFDVDAETVGIQSGFVHQFTAGAGDAFQMDISVEAMHQSQVFGNTHKAFHRIVGVADNAGTEKQTFYIVATIELHRQLHQFGYGEGGTRKVVTTPVDAVGAIVDAVIGKHDFQQ